MAKISKNIEEYVKKEREKYERNWKEIDKIAYLDYDSFLEGIILLCSDYNSSFREKERKLNSKKTYVESIEFGIPQTSISGGSIHFLNKYYIYSKEFLRNSEFLVKDNLEKFTIIYYEVKTGGVAGGSCYSESDDDLYDYDTDERVDGEYFLNILISLLECVDKESKVVSVDLEYLNNRKNELRNFFREDSRTHYEYYGNYDNYEIMYIYVWDIYEFLVKERILLY